MQKKAKFLTIAQAAQFLKVSPDTLRRWENKGIITPQRTQGGSRRYTILDLKIAKLNKKKTRFFQIPTLFKQNYINSRQDLKIALLTSFLWIFGLLTYHFLPPLLLRPTNLNQQISIAQPEDQTHLKIASEPAPGQTNAIKALAIPDQVPVADPANGGADKTTPSEVSQGSDLLINHSGNLPAIKYTDTLNQYYSLQPLPQNQNSFNNKKNLII